MGIIQLGTAHFRNYKPLGPHWLTYEYGPEAHQILTCKSKYLGAPSIYYSGTSVTDYGSNIRDPEYFRITQGPQKSKINTNPRFVAVNLALRLIRKGPQFGR